MIRPRYILKQPPGLLMNLYSLISRREFAMGISKKYELDGQKVKEMWKSHLAQMVNLHGKDDEEKSHFLELMNRINFGKDEQAPFYFFTLLDYALLSTFLTLAPHKIVNDDHLLYDSTRYEGKEEPFFCQAGAFSFIRQKVRGSFMNFFKASGSIEFFTSQARMVAEYYGTDLYRVEEVSPTKWVMEAENPPEVSRDDCMSNITIFYNGWKDILPVADIAHKNVRCREESCVALGNKTCRFVFEKDE